MSGRYLTELADWLRAAGLEVVEVNGWQTRARGSGGYADGRPWCVMWHHTASNSSPDNDVSYIINSDDAPLANLYLARDGSVHVCAAGATNTNGKGGPLTMSRGVIGVDAMNVYAVGIEAANDGIGEQWGAAMVDAYFKMSLALTNNLGLLADDVSSHEHWSPGRKIDPAVAAGVLGPWRPVAINGSGTWSNNDIRDECLTRNESGSPTPVPPEPPPTKGSMMFTLFDMGGYGGETYGGYMDANGIFAQVTWLSPKRANDTLAAGAKHIGRLSPNDLGNCDLLGPLPEGTPRDTFANVIG